MWNCWMRCIGRDVSDVGKTRKGKRDVSDVGATYAERGKAGEDNDVGEAT
jgi:hypothetical protein